jgi:hypothetical protein
MAAALPIIMGVTGGLQALSGLLGNRSQTTLSREQADEQRRQFDAQMAQGQAQQGLAATQMDPLKQQQSRQRMALVEQLMRGASSPRLEGNRFVGGFQFTPEMFKNIASFYSPEARLAAEQQFAGQATSASGGRYGTPNFGAMGYGSAVGGQALVPTTTQMPSPGDVSRIRRDGWDGGPQRAY